MYYDSVTVIQFAMTLAPKLKYFAENPSIPSHLHALTSLQYSKRLAKNTSYFLEAFNDAIMTTTKAFNGRD